MTELITPLGVHLALFFPFFVYSLVSPDAIRESKVFVQGLMAAVVLAGLAFDALREGPSVGRPRAPRALSAAALATLALVVASGLAGAFSWTDPLVLVPVGAAAALFLAGASGRGDAIRSRALPVLCLAGAATGVLAVLQRKAGLFLLPLEGDDPRYRATAFIGSPGDVGAALLLPALVLVAGVMDADRSPRSRLLHAAGLVPVLLGMTAAEALTPLVAAVAGIVVFALFDIRRRARTLAALGLLGAVAVLATGALGRFVRLVDTARLESLSEVVTERDIGLYAAAEMVRDRPVLGEGPGNYSNAFVPARVRAEARLGRRLVHSSPSSHFENAHNEWLTFAAECGLPAALLGSTSLVLLLFHLGRSRQDLLFALVFSLAVLGLASFPSRLAVVAGPAAFVLGLASRAVAKRPSHPSRGVPGRTAFAVLLPAGLLLAALAVARGASTYLQADGEAALRGAATAEGAGRSVLLEIARDRLRLAAALRARQATTWLALGSTHRLDRDLPAAKAAFERSFDLEERAETDLNLGRVEHDAGERQAALAWFRRAIWVLPRLRLALPPDVDALALERDIRTAEEELARGGSPPPPVRSPRRGARSRSSGSG